MEQWRRRRINDRQIYDDTHDVNRARLSSILCTRREQSTDQRNKRQKTKTSSKETDEYYIVCRLHSSGADTEPVLTECDCTRFVSHHDKRENQVQQGFIGQTTLGPIPFEGASLPQPIHLILRAFRWIAFAHGI